MKKRTFNYYQDPAHGWVKVPVKLLQKLNIEKEISAYSYFRGDYAYLEEDLDASLFDKSMVENGFGTIYKQFHTNKSSKIRNYKSYCAREIFGTGLLNKKS
jgi:hypothetical protein